MGPSPEAYSPQTIVPKEATKEDLEKFKADWVAAVKRALKAGVDVSRGSVARSTEVSQVSHIF